MTRPFLGLVDFLAGVGQVMPEAQIAFVVPGEAMQLRPGFQVSLDREVASPWPDRVTPTLQTFIVHIVGGGKKYAIRYAIICIVE